MGGDSSRVKASSLSTSSFSSSASSSLAHGTATGFVTGGVTAPGLGSTVFGSGNTRSRNFAMYEQGDDDVIVQTEKSESSTEWYTYQTGHSHGNIAGDGTVAVSESRRRRGSDAIAWLIAMVGFSCYWYLSTEGQKALTVNLYLRTPYLDITAVLFHSELVLAS